MNENTGKPTIWDEILELSMLWLEQQGGKRQINRCSLWVSWGYSNKEPQTRRLTREISSLKFWRLSLK